MDWLFIALPSTASFALALLVDKYLLARFVRSSSAYVLVLIILQQIFVLIVSAFAGWGFSYPVSVYAMLAGMAQAAMYVSYLRALQVEEASRVTSLIFVYPLFVFPGSALLLGEILNMRHYAGGMILVASALLVSHRPRQGRSIAFSPALRYLGFFWIFSALYAIGIKYLSFSMHEWHIFIWSSLGTLLAVLPFLLNREIRQEAVSIFRWGPILFGLILAEEVFDFLGRLLSIFAFSQGPVSLVSAVGALQPTITLICILALGHLDPCLLAEELDRRTLGLKLVAGILVALGVYLVS